MVAAARPQAVPAPAGRGASGRAAAGGQSGSGASAAPTVGLEVRPRWWQPIMRVAVLVAGDILALLASLAAGYLLWARPVHHHGLRMYDDVPLVVPVFIIGYALSGLYPGFGLGAVETLRRLTQRTTFTFVVLAAGLFVFKLPTYYSRVAFVLAWVGALVAVPIVRYLVLLLVAGRPWWTIPTLLAGDVGRVETTLCLLRSALSLGYRPVGILTLEAAPQPLPTPAGVPILGTVERAPELAAMGVTTVLVFSGDDRVGNSLGGRLRRYFRHVVLLGDDDQLPVERVAIRNLGGILGIEFSNDLFALAQPPIKRVTDLDDRRAVLLAAAPVIAVAAAVVRLVSRGPVFFAQAREGLDGRVIRVWKLRTMHLHAEARLHRHLEDDPEARAEWESKYKLRKDPRVVRVRGLLASPSQHSTSCRSSGNVLRATMSLVGRSLPSTIWQEFPDAFRELRRRVRPGVTGLWQVMIRSDGGTERSSASCDSYYIRNWSIWMDLYVLAKTPFVVAKGNGAYLRPPRRPRRPQVLPQRRAPGGSVARAP